MGLSNLTSDVGIKQLELLRSMLPRLSRVAVLLNPANPAVIVPTDALFIQNYDRIAELTAQQPPGAGLRPLMLR